MPWILEFMSDLAARLTAAEAAMLIGLLLVMVLGLALPYATLRRERAYRARDDEFRRLQNM